MDEVLIRAIVIINEKIDKLNVSKTNGSYYIDQLVVLRDDLQKLFSLTSSTNNLVLLFCRRLARLMDYNKLIPTMNWIDLHAELLYVLEHHDVPIEKLNSTKFSSILKLESKLQEREIRFKGIFGNIKKLHELVEEHRNSLHDYLQICCSLHSKLGVRGLTENVDDLLHKTCQQTDMQFTFQTKECLQTKLRCIEIPLTYSYNLLQGCLPKSFLDFRSREELKGSENNFLPGMDEIKILGDTGISHIHERLEESRWIVILGDPGSAKTTLMRYIMQLFSWTALRGDERVLIKKVDWGPVRIPILIRISEFAEWLEDHPSMTLIDYIGNHTWFSQFYGSDNTEYVLKEFIHHGHALILLDGLDEIHMFERRRQIVNLVREFIHDHVHGHDFLSAFDDVPENFNEQPRKAVDSDERSQGCSWRLEETHPPSMPGGNQIIITSRVVGYNSYRLESQLIKHYFIPPMPNNKATLFVKQWFDSVDQEVQSILLSEGIHLDSERMNKAKILRQNALNNVFCDTRKELLLHPLMLSMICSCIFKLSNDILLPKSVVELYHETVQSAIRNGMSQQQSSIPQNVIMQFETDLALYLHSHSSSGIIDEFDIKRLCYLVLKQQGLSKSNAKLRQYTDELIALVSSNGSIVVERGLKVFSFVHLSFQEYFVALSLLKPSSIDAMVTRFLAYSIRPRSHEPLRLAFSRMSEVWPLNDYVNFCRKLVTQSVDYTIPLGALLLFDILSDVRRSPSSKTICIALDSLMDHPSRLISIGYLGKNWPILPTNTILKWMQLSLINEKRVFKFCKSFLHSIFLIEHQMLWKQHSDSLPAICQRLWSFRSISLSVEFIITQTLQLLTASLDLPHPIFQDELPQYLISRCISESDIHPLVLSVIIALYGGIHKTEDKIYFSPKYMYRNSSVFIPLIEYFENTKECHSTKVQKLIEQYEQMLRKFSSEDISNNTIDIFIALICLRGLSQLSVYHEFGAYRALPLALNRFKWILFFLRDGTRFQWKHTTKLIFSKIKSIMDMFFSQSVRTPLQCKWFSLACIAACDKLEIDWLRYLSSFEDFFVNNNINRHPEPSCRLIKYFYNIILYKQSTHVWGEPIPQAIKDVHLFKMLNDQLLVLLNFVPDSLERLYHRLVIIPDSQHDSLPLIVLLSQCLIFFDGYIESEEMFVTLCDWLPLFKKHNLENYVLALFWEGKSRYKCNQTRSDFDFFARFSTHFSRSCEELIAEEQQRIIEAKQSNEVRQKDIQLFAASLSLARLFRVQYLNDTSKDEIYYIDMNLLIDESKQVLSAIENISDPVLYIIATNTILDMEYPYVFYENQNDVLRSRIVFLLLQILPSLPLLMSTLLFVRCQSIRQAFPSIFQNLTKAIGEKLVSVPMDEEIVQDQEAAYVALNMINDSSLTPYLIEFEKRTENLGDLLEMNSVIFHRYFTDITLFGESDHVLLSSMYLSQLSVDAQILKKNINFNEQNAISSSEKLNQWLIESKNVITFEIATLITSCIETCNKEDVVRIVSKVFDCHIVQKNAQPVFLHWFNCPMNESIKPIVYYVALLLAKDGCITPTSIVYIDELCRISIDQKFKNIIRNFLELQSIDSVLLRDVLVKLIRCAHRSSLRARAIVRSCEIMKLILQLEYEQLCSNINYLSFDRKSFLMIVNGCSLEVQIYLSKYLLTITNVDSEVSNTIKEQYLARIITWVMQHFAFKRCKISDILYNSIISFFHNQQFPHAQEAVVNGLKYIFMKMSDGNIFANKDIKILLDNAINLYAKSVDTNSENFLITCLHAYGYCLRFYKHYKNENLSNEMHSLLTVLFETSSSPLISARAGQCLLLIELHVHNGSVFNWLNKTNLKPEQIYNVFTQCTFDEYRLLGGINREEQLIHVLLGNQTDLIPKFIKEIYIYLHKAATICNLSKQVFSYINTALGLCKDNLAIFRSAIEQCSFSEQEFKRVLYVASKQGNDAFRIKCAQLYASFGDLTPDLIDMILNIDHEGLANILLKIENLIDGKRILLDRDTIERLYAALESPSQQIHATQLLLHLAHADFVSMLEVFQQISPNINKRSSENLNDYQDDYENLFLTLLRLSCIASEGMSWKFSHELLQRKDKAAIYTEQQIDKFFDRVNRPFQRHVVRRIFSDKDE